MSIKLLKSIAFALAIEVLLTSIGIAQVSHICKMAMHGIEAESCSQTTTNDHDCCKTIINKTESKLNNCCTDKIKYYQNKITTTIQETNKLTVYSPASSISHNRFINFSNINELEQITFLNTQQPNSPPKKIFIAVQSFLI